MKSIYISKLKIVSTHPSQVSPLTGGNKHSACKLFHYLDQLTSSFSFALSACLFRASFLAFVIGLIWSDSQRNVFFSLIQCLLIFARYAISPAGWWCWFVHFHWLITLIESFLCILCIFMGSFNLLSPALTIYLVIKLSVFLQSL